MSNKLKPVVIFSVLALTVISLLNYQTLPIWKMDNLKFNLDQCNCVRTIETAQSNESYTNHSLVNYNETMCGMDAFRRGSNQKVVAFSFYEPSHMSDWSKQKGYFAGLIPSLYPGWTMRLYHSLPPDNPRMRELCELVCRNDFLDLCDVRHLPQQSIRYGDLFPMLWRFLPSLDNQVSMFLSRDLDSQLSLREVEAVNEWEKSYKSIHVMRDHPQHNIPIMGGTFGARLTSKTVRERWKRSWKYLSKNKLAFSDQYKVGPDQKLLQRYIWRWGKRSAMQHDSYHCTEFPGSIGFPSPRKNNTNNFVGAHTHVEPNMVWKMCPKSCRRKPQWKFC